MNVQGKSKTIARIQQKLDDIESYQQHISSRLTANNNMLICRDNDGPCYEPEIVRIGLNHGMLWYETMYEDKYKYLQSLLRQSKTSLDTYVMAMENLVQRALECYESPMSGELGVYLEMMLLDSGFIIELFRKYDLLGDRIIFNENQKERNIIHSLRRDLIRIGNQLPFFVLREIFDMTLIGSNRSLIDLALKFFDNLVGPYEVGPNLNIQHLLDLVYFTFLDPYTLSLPFVTKPIELQFIDHATELHKAGIKFKKIEGRNFFDIKFKNGVLEIPPLQVADSKLYLLRILMEYEKQFSPQRYFNDYAKFMQCLLNSAKDVNLLRRSGIIDNQLGNDELIFDRLNQLGSEAEISYLFTYSSLLKNVNDHCRLLRNKWLANLWRKYFNSSSSFISFLAAVVLLLLTLTQTVFSIVSYHPPP